MSRESPEHAPRQEACRSRDPSQSLGMTAQLIESIGMTAQAAAGKITPASGLDDLVQILLRLFAARLLDAALAVEPSTDVAFGTGVAAAAVAAP